MFTAVQLCGYTEVNLYCYVLYGEARYLYITCTSVNHVVYYNAQAYPDHTATESVLKTSLRDSTCYRQLCKPDLASPTGDVQTSTDCESTK